MRFDLKTKNSNFKTDFRFTDWHCHLLPGVDDGAESFEDALEMAELLAGAGFDEICCTPHRIKGLYEMAADEVVRRVTELQERFKKAGVRLTLHPGMEHYLDEFFLEAPEEWLPLGRSGHILVELPSQYNPEVVREGIFQVRRRGFTPLLAHPERVAFPAERRATGRGWSAIGRLIGRAGEGGHRDVPSFLTDLATMGCRFQGNLGSFAGYYGGDVRVRAQRFLSSGLYSHIGSDGHCPASLIRNLKAGLEAVKRSPVSSESERGGENMAWTKVGGQAL